MDYHEDGKLRCYYLARPAMVKSLLRFISGEYPVVKQSKESVRQTGRRQEKIAYPADANQGG